MLKPPTPDQVDMYDVCEEDGDLFHVTPSVHMQCQLREGDLVIHNIKVDERAHRTGIGRSVLRQLRTEYPDTRIVANGVEWPEPAGCFWKAMMEEGLVDLAVTYQHGEISIDTVDDAEPVLTCP